MSCKYRQLIIYPCISQCIENHQSNVCKIYLPNKVHEDSITLLRSTNDSCLESINYEHVMNDDILTIGKTVIISEKVGPLTKNIKGKLTRIAEDYVEVEYICKGQCKTCRVYKYSQICVDGWNTQNHLNIEIPKDCNTSSIHLSYLFDGLIWSNQYFCILSHDLQYIEYIQAIATIKNNTGKSINTSSIVLMCGNQEEYIKYNINESCNINNLIKIQLFTDTKIKSRKFYIMDLEKDTNCYFGYWIVPERHYPVGSIDIYHSSNNECSPFGNYIYTSCITTDHNIGDNLLLICGQSNKVCIEKSFEKSHGPDGTEEINYQIKILNNTQHVILFVYKLWIGNNHYKFYPKETRLKNGYLEWVVNVDSMSELLISGSGSF